MESIDNKNEIILFKTSDEKIKIDVLFENETVWLTQEQMAELFEKGRSTITEHIQNIFKDGELDENMVCREFRRTTQHGAMKGKTQNVDVKIYNLDVFISVGYRVKSIRGTHFLRINLMQKTALLLCVKMLASFSQPKWIKTISIQHQN